MRFSMNIYRQHDETELSEIYGMECKKILAIPGELRDVVHALYMYVGSIWLRLFVDLESLFVDECDGPDPEDDLNENEEYVDYGYCLENIDSNIDSATMKNGQFTIILRGKVIITLTETDGGTLIKIM